MLFTEEAELTPLVAHQHWTSCMSRAVVSLATGKQVVPKYCSVLESNDNVNIFTIVRVELFLNQI